MAKTKRETTKLQVREKRKLRHSEESCKDKTPSEFCYIHCTCFGSYQDDTGTERQWLQEQKGNGYSANVKDGSMKTVLIMMTPIQVMHSVHFVDFPHTTFHYVCIVYKDVLVKGHYIKKHSFVWGPYSLVLLLRGFILTSLKWLLVELKSTSDR